MSPILVTGATGTTGSAALAELISQGVEVLAMTSSPEKKAMLEARGIPSVLANYNDPSSLQNALKHASRLFLVSPASLDLVQNEKNVIDVARLSNIQQIVKISAFGASEQAPFQLGKMHAAIEQHLALSGIPYTVLRPQGYMQNIINSAATIKNQNTIFASLENSAFPMIDARDIGVAAARILSEPTDAHHKKVYNITGPRAIGYKDVANALSNKLGRPIKYVSISDEEARTSMLASGVPEWMVNDLISLNQMWRSGNFNEPTSQLDEIMGRPSRSLPTFIREHLKYFR